MSCDIVRIDPQTPDPATIERAAQILRRGGLVVFPTETVYGLGGNALDAAAVTRIFAAKGRPARNPLIVHVADAAGARTLVSDWPDIAQRLADAFWPGPLTLVLPKSPAVCDLVTAAGSTVAIRAPAHPAALALLHACGLPLAAPSANSSNQLSPTRAEHVAGKITDMIDLILDAGPTPGGLESTVLDVTCFPPRLLRPGLVTRSAIEAVIGPIEFAATAVSDQSLRSPGQLRRHYAPNTPLEMSANSKARVETLASQGLRVGWLTHREEDVLPAVFRILLPANARDYSAHLYAAMHQLDETGLDRIVVETPPAGDAWLAVHDRLRRASEPESESEPEA